jgi:hypothetical protein
MRSAMSFSSQNIIEEKINHFKEKNTAFSWGQILLEENDTVEGVLSLLEQSPDIQQHYVQYPVPECKIEFGGYSLSVPPKQFGSISNESMNIGVMPRDGENAITPSLAKQFAQDIRTLIGKEIVFYKSLQDGVRSDKGCQQPRVYSVWKMQEYLSHARYQVLCVFKISA